MKITQEKPPKVFTPITIVLENAEEVCNLRKDLEKVYYDQIFKGGSHLHTMYHKLNELNNQS